ncbi:alpha-mannosidase [Cyanobium sp. WAJ14-Wanaka]|nr:alpha-mannosidase [Cyanobium sp. WAJ14-Wanaka]
MPEAPGAPQTQRIETFQSRFSWDLQSLWGCMQPDGSEAAALQHPWGGQHRPDWQARGLVIWPRGGQWHQLRLELVCPEAWRGLADQAIARLTLRWWADQAELWVDGRLVHGGDLFDTACRWPLPASWWQGTPLALELRLRSPLHDDGALIASALVLEPKDPADPQGLLLETKQALADLRRHGSEPAANARFHVLGHAHLDLAWLWPVADTWQAAERTFASVLSLMERFPELHFAHSTPALYAWLEQGRPDLFGQLLEAVAAGRFEPINGPWVESDCVLISTASLLRQFQLGQHYSRRTFPQLEHGLAWLPDSFGFGAGLPAVAQATGVRWFCTHKLFWNATNPFPHRLFRWRGRCGAEVLALMTAPIGTDGDPVAMERYRLEWTAATGSPQALWLPGVGDHGGGPTAEMLEQLELWHQQGEAVQQHQGSLRTYLDGLATAKEGLPVWRDELYLELHRGCATSRPDQKRHNRSLERLLREAELATGLAGASLPAATKASAAIDWRVLLFQQFHDILPGTSIPEVFEQAEPQWRQARRQARQQRDWALQAWLAGGRHPQADPQSESSQHWWVAQLQPLAPQAAVLRLPPGQWSCHGQRLPQQSARGGASWVQLPSLAGVVAQPLQRQLGAQPAPAAGLAGISHPVELETLPGRAGDSNSQGRWRVDNGLVGLEVGAGGLVQLWGADGVHQLAAPLAWQRFGDSGEFWDAWDLAADYREHPLPWAWQEGPVLTEQGPLCCSFVQRGYCGDSSVRLEVRLRAGSSWVELLLQVDWRARHELLRLEIPLLQPAQRWAADTSGGILERPAEAITPRELARWEVPVISWLASVPGQGGLAVLLDGPQGVSAAPGALGVSLLRAPTWPDPGADNGYQRLRLALMPCPGHWQQDQVPQQAIRFREPLWLRPAESPIPGRATQPGLPPLGDGLQLVSCRAGSGPGELLVAVQNSSPGRRQLDLGADWTLLARLDGLDQQSPQKLSVELKPWTLGFWLVGPTQSS